MKKVKILKAIAIMILITIFTSQSSMPLVADLLGGSNTTTVFAATAAKKVVMNKKSLALEIGDSVVLKATVSPSTTTNKKVKWNSSNKKVAAVSSKGKVKALQVGSTNITVKTSNGKTAVCKVTVIEGSTDIIGIKLSSSELTMDLEENMTLVATISPSDAENSGLSWSSSDEEIVYVDSEGTLYPEKEGTAIITAEADNGIKASCKVIITDAGVGNVSFRLKDTSLNLFKNDAYTLVAEIVGDEAEDYTITWVSSNPNVVRVLNKGELLAISAGKATITATFSGGKNASCEVTVSEKFIDPTAIVLSQSSISLKVGGVSNLLAEVLPSSATDKTVNWTSSNTAIATVDTKGGINAKAKGTAIITASTVKGIKATCEIIVSETIIETTSITLSKTNSSLKSGESISLSATVLPSNATNKSVSWISADSNIAMVDNAGYVTAKAKGTTIITASSSNGLKATCEVVVSEIITEATSIKLSQTNASIDASGSVGLAAEVLPSNATNKVIAWSSSNDSVATVDGNGYVMGRTKGTATITASTVNGMKATCNVTVTETAKRVSLNDGIYKITLKGTNVTLDVNGASSANGANVQVYESNDSNAQKWSAKNLADNTLSFFPLCASDKVLDIMRTNNSTSGALASGCNADIYTNNDVPAQSFYLEQFNEGSYSIHLNSNSNLVIQATAASSGANVIIANYDENSSLQRWSITPATVAPPVQTREAWVFNTGGLGVFVRNIGSTSGTQVGGFSEGQKISVIGEITNGWYQVKGADRNSGAEISGYSHGDYITFTPPVVDTGTSISIRTVAPASDDYHYYSNQNIYYSAGYGMPNCTAYAWGRIWEIYGTQLPSNGFRNNAHTWWTDNINLGKYKYGSEPRVGSIAVWNSSLPYSGGCGHVAVVEKIEGGTVYISQSVYGGYTFKYAQLGNTGYLLGYIYVDQPNY